ncbi:DNA-binding transcriptional regulator, LysR family [Thalassovita litoralis]|jgi:DNA-binding transcriptional LysR family regulator|uniref:DNA-binding transcriptional regulator, LysR family n=1 Tax=Thalassovita litoralis TaxID=1010611 RepID=A0A521BKT7_9RHOB|nr:LysR family transcriptional regulator [Thalassovita litoralis]SMO47767.1 DNA-binding transcriptional regulator, LysR family [Thalassovita litoralis]
MLRYTLRQLEYFVAVGDTGSIAKASERINVSSPSISAAITQLEQEFGLPLFVRQHAQGLSLTQGGRQMLEQARVVLREAGLLMDIAGDISGSVRGPMSVGCLVTFAQMVLPALRRSFEADYPDVRLRQYELNQADIISGLRRSEIDVALTYDLEVPADLQFAPLVELPPFVLVNEAHPLAGRAGVSVADLRDHPMVLLDLPLSADYFLSFFAGTGTKPRIAERTRDMAVMRSLVANGYGYSIANVRPLNSLSPDGKPLQFIPMTGPVRAMKMGLLMPRDADKSNAVRAFLQHSRAAVARGDLPGLGRVDASADARDGLACP